MSLSAATLRKDQLDRARFRRDVPETASIARSPRRIPPFVLLALAIFVSVAPLINLIAILLTLERDQQLSFSQVGFQPVGIGISTDGNIANKDTYAGQCDRAATSFSKLAEQQAEFYICQQTSQYIFSETAAQASVISLRVSARGEIQVLFFAAADATAFALGAWGDLSTDNEVYRLKDALSKTGARSLLASIATEYDSTCRDERIVYTDQDVSVSIENGRLFAQVSVQCERIDPPGREAALLPPQHHLLAARTFFQLLSFVPATTFEAVLLSELLQNSTAIPAWKDSLHLPIITVRRSYLSLGILFIVVGVVLVFRGIIKFLTRNDVYDALEQIVERGVGKSMYEMVRCSDEFRYNHKYSVGPRMHYGVSRPGLTTVRGLGGGVIGFLEEDIEGENWSSESFTDVKPPLVDRIDDE